MLDKAQFHISARDRRNPTAHRHLQDLPIGIDATRRGYPKMRHRRCSFIEKDAKLRCARWRICRAYIMGHRPVVRTAVFGAANLGSNPSAPATKTAGQRLINPLTCFIWAYFGHIIQPSCDVLAGPAVFEAVTPGASLFLGAPNAGNCRGHAVGVHEVKRGPYAPL